jgi:hypothetical protein
MWTIAIPALGKLRQEVFEFETNLVYILKLVPKNFFSRNHDFT